MCDLPLLDRSEECNGRPKSAEHDGRAMGDSTTGAAAAGNVLRWEGGIRV
eukprot:CAMPEP_0174696874 /NCGR_PEP_ID=MMETSP1094-20130205/2907_1 /TAXON_ID=156173 /ORGANISM="Chrysochromulina brevifilum, Strain UTEX LB 985" /LENGTH=49 /DNA_ID=CAMNT_0015893743 /DNA_START=107 /DNA_END=256 /DNA_ORIENTATION=+